DQRAHDEQCRRGPGGSRFEDLGFVEDEILPENRTVDSPNDRFEIADRSAEVGSVGQNRDCNRTMSDIAVGLLRRIPLRPDDAGRRVSTLHRPKQSNGLADKAGIERWRWW